MFVKQLCIDSQKTQLDQFITVGQLNKVSNLVTSHNMQGQR